MTESPAKRGIAVEEAVVYGLLAAHGRGAFVMALDYGLFKDESRVGPGLVPAVVGGLIAIVAGWELIATLRGHRTKHDQGLAEIVAVAVPDASQGGASSESTALGGAPSGHETSMSPDDGPVDIGGAGPGPDDIDIFGRTPKERGRQLVMVSAALLVACVLVPVLGFLLSFFLMSMFISIVVERRGWLPSLVASSLAIAAVYGVFVGFLGVPLPTGLIGIGG